MRSSSGVWGKKRRHSEFLNFRARHQTANLDNFWLKDNIPEDSANLSPPDVIAAEIMEDLQAALEQFREIAADLGPKESES